MKPQTRGMRIFQWTAAAAVYVITVAIMGHMIRVRDNELATARAEIGIYQDFVKTQKVDLKSTIKSVGNLVNAIADEAEKRGPVANAEEEKILNEYVSGAKARTAEMKQVRKFVFTADLNDFFAKSDADIELIRTDFAKPVTTRIRIISAIIREQMYQLHDAQIRALPE